MPRTSDNYYREHQIICNKDIQLWGSLHIFTNRACSIYIARTFLGHKLNYGGQHFWARGYYVSTAGRDEKTIRDYIKKQERHDRKLDQWNLFDKTPKDPS